MFKVGDFVRVKPGTKLESGEVVDNWGGEVFFVDKDEDLYGIGLDALSLDSTSDAYLTDALRRGEESVEYFFNSEDLEPATARSTEEEVMAAVDRLVEREMKIERAEEERMMAQHEDWKSAFRKSPEYDQLANVETANIDMALNTFLDYLYNYEGVWPEGWQPTHVKQVCLYWAPAKVVADPKDFKQYGTVVMALLSFLGRAGHIDNADELIQAVDEVKDRIPKEAAKESKWSLTKAGLMDAKAQGHDLSEEEAIRSFLLKKQQREALKPQPTMPAQDPFKDIGRNQKITVLYKDGTTKADIKFKKVEKDLRAGRCELVGS
jgi:hypothetical protein